MSNEPILDLSLTAELVFKEDSGETYFYEYGTAINPNFHEEGNLNIHELLPEKFQAWFYNEVSLVPIELMKDLIDKAEKAGANYVSIFYHGDHNEYEVMGVNLHEETSQELALRLKKEAKILNEKQSEAKMKIVNYAKQCGFQVKFE